MLGDAVVLRVPEIEVQLLYALVAGCAEPVAILRVEGHLPALAAVLFLRDPFEDLTHALRLGRILLGLIFDHGRKPVGGGGRKRRLALASGERESAQTEDCEGT